MDICEIVAVARCTIPTCLFDLSLSLEWYTVHKLHTILIILFSCFFLQPCRSLVALPNQQIDLSCHWVMLRTRSTTNRYRKSRFLVILVYRVLYTLNSSRKHCIFFNFKYLASADRTRFTGKIWCYEVNASWLKLTVETYWRLKQYYLLNANRFETTSKRQLVSVYLWVNISYYHPCKIPV